MWDKIKKFSDNFTELEFPSLWPVWNYLREHFGLIPTLLGIPTILSLHFVFMMRSLGGQSSLDFLGVAFITQQIFALGQICAIIYLLLLGIKFTQNWRTWTTTPIGNIFSRTFGLAMFILILFFIAAYLGMQWNSREGYLLALYTLIFLVLFFLFVSSSIELRSKQNYGYKVALILLMILCIGLVSSYSGLMRGNYLKTANPIEIITTEQIDGFVTDQISLILKSSDGITVWDRTNENLVFLPMDKIIAIKPIKE